jgi:hypothetical protein
MAMMRMRVVPLEGAPIEVPVTPKVIVAAERHFKTSMAKLFNPDNVSFEAMSWIAWQAMQHSGHVVKTFDLWLDGIENIESIDEPSAPLADGAV